MYGQHWRQRTALRNSFLTTCHYPFHCSTTQELPDQPEHSSAAVLTPSGADIIGAEQGVSMPSNTTRRFFIGAVTAAAASRVWGANDRISVAIVGLGGRGTNHLNIYSRLPEARVTALVDVNQAAREKAQATLLKNTGEKG